VISNRQLWTAASLLVKCYGADAEIEAARRADLMVDRGTARGSSFGGGSSGRFETLQAPQTGKAH
jgi:hypothetical protein